MKKNILFSLCLVVVLVFAGCAKDNDEDTPNNPPIKETGLFKGVIKECRLTKEELINELCEQIPAIESAKPILSLLLSDLHFASIRYTTTGVDGNVVEASGVVVYRADVTEYDHILSIQHGTQDIANAPSLTTFNIELAPAIKGEVVVMADYSGYGISQTPTLQHPYLHTKLTGTTCADMIEAAEQYLDEKTSLTKTDDNIKLIGYSQGGAATVATVLELEKRGYTDRIAEAYAGSGPYKVFSFITNYISDPDMEYERNGYFPFFFRGMAYGEHLTINDTNIYAPYLIEHGYHLLFSTTQLTELHEILGKRVGNVLHPDFYKTDYNGNEDIKKLVDAAERNSLTNYHAPHTPIKLYHSPHDTWVPYYNSATLHQQWPNTTLIDLELTSHIDCGVEFMLKYMGLWEIFQRFLE